jgi:hypothetical protein
MHRKDGKPLSLFAMMDSVMTRPRRCVVASPGPSFQRRVGALSMADPALTGNEFFRLPAADMQHRVIRILCDYSGLSH